MKARATAASKSLKDSVPNPTLKSSIPPNKEVKRSAINSILQVDFINSQMNAKTIELKKITVIAIINFILKPSNIS